MSKKQIINNDLLTVRVGTEPVVDAVESVVDAVESVAVETVEDVVEVGEYLVTVTRNNPWVIGGVAVVAAGVGGYFGYRYAVKKLVAHYDERLIRAQQESRAYYEKLASRGDFGTKVTEEDVVSAAALLENYQGDEDNPYGARTPEDKTTLQEIQDTTEPASKVVGPRSALRDGNWDIDQELALRSTLEHGEPYVISYEEFNEGLSGQDPDELIWYEGDSTLADMRGSIIPDTNRYIGDDNLLRFGEGSGDADMVYVRNEATGTDYQVNRSIGKFTKEVLGFNDEEKPGQLRHSSGRRRLRAQED